MLEVAAGFGSLRTCHFLGKLHGFGMAKKSRKAQEIIIGKGLSDLPFGVTQDEVEKLFGKPDSKNELDLKDDVTMTWDYWEIGLSLDFDKSDDFTLSSMEVSDKHVTLLGERLIEKSESDVRAAIAKLKLGTPTDEDGGFGFEDLGIYFWFAGGCLEEIHWSKLAE